MLRDSCWEIDSPGRRRNLDCWRGHAVLANSARNTRGQRAVFNAGRLWLDLLKHQERQARENDVGKTGRPLRWRTKLQRAPGKLVERWSQSAEIDAAHLVQNQV